MRMISILLMMLPFAALADLAPMMPPSIEDHPCLVLLTFVGLVIVSVMTGNKVCGKLMDKMTCRFGVCSVDFGNCSLVVLRGCFSWLS